jgi:hypothetical protein
MMEERVLGRGLDDRDTRTFLGVMGCYFYCSDGLKGAKLMSKFIDSFKLNAVSKFHSLYANYTTIKLENRYWGKWEKFENKLGMVYHRIRPIIIFQDAEELF